MYLRAYFKIIYHYLEILFYPQWSIQHNNSKLIKECLGYCLKNRDEMIYYLNCKDEMAIASNLKGEKDIFPYLLIIYLLN